MKELTNCPFCNGELTIKEVQCNVCHTEIKGKFNLTRFHLFNQEQLYFIEIFLKNEGNIKLVEKDLGISYPTVRGRLQKIVEILGYTPQISTEEKDEKSKERLKILNALKKGNLNFDETLKKLGDLK